MAHLYEEEFEWRDDKNEMDASAARARAAIISKGIDPDTVVSTWERLYHSDKIRLTVDFRAGFVQ